MTEKRFTILNMGLDGNFIKDTGKIMMIDDVVRLLNMLHEENNNCKEIMSNMAERLLKYEKENEQLKKELRNLRRLANEVYMEGSE